MLELNRKLENLKNKAEYGIQVLWDPTVILPRIREQNAEIQQLEKEIRLKPAGVAYLLQKKLEELVREKVDSGLYNNASEVIREALRLMQEHDEIRRLKLERLRDELAKMVGVQVVRPAATAAAVRRGRRLAKAVRAELAKSVTGSLDETVRSLRGRAWS